MWLANAPQRKIAVTRTMLPTASRWRMKRRRAKAHWLRALISRPYSKTSSAPGGATTPPPAAAAATGVGPGCVSGIANPRVEVAVDDVGEQVGEDDDDRGHEQPRHDGVEVELVELVAEVEAHAVEAEDRLGDDRPAEQAADVERDHGHERDEGVAEDVLHDHAPFRKALRPRGAHVVGVDHLEHRRAHKTAVERKVDDHERRDRQPQVLDAVERERAFTRVIEPGRVENAQVPLQVDVDEEDLKQEGQPECRHGEAEKT